MRRSSPNLILALILISQCNLQSSMLVCRQQQARVATQDPVVRILRRRHRTQARPSATLMAAAELR
jgi:hypothetical protein